MACQPYPLVRKEAASRRSSISCGLGILATTARTEVATDLHELYGEQGIGEIVQGNIERPRPSPRRGRPECRDAAGQARNRRPLWQRCSSNMANWVLWSRPALWEGPLPLSGKGRPRKPCAPGAARSIFQAKEWQSDQMAPACLSGGLFGDYCGQSLELRGYRRRR